MTFIASTIFLALSIFAILIAFNMDGYEDTERRKAALFISAAIAFECSVFVLWTITASCSPAILMNVVLNIGLDFYIFSWILYYKPFGSISLRHANTYVMFNSINVIGTVTTGTISLMDPMNIFVSAIVTILITDVLLFFLKTRFKLLLMILTINYE